MSRYLVTGCAGFIGSHLSEALLDRGDDVVGIDAYTDYYDRELKEANVELLHERPAFALLEADLFEMSFPSVLEGIDGVFHLAAQPGVRGSWGETFGVYVRDNIVVSQRVFEAAAQTGIRVVWASSSSVYGNAEAFPTREDARPQPVSPYGVTKLACEALADAYAANAGLEAVGLRYFTVYGPRQRPDMAFTRIARALAEEHTFPVFGDGRQSRDVTYVADAVSASLLAMERGKNGVNYNVGGGSETSLREVIAVCENLSGRKLRLHFEDQAAGDVRRTSADTRAAQVDLGWFPAASLEAGLRAQLEWAGVVRT